MNTVKQFTIAVIYLKSKESTREPDYNTSLISNGNRKELQPNALICPIYPVSGTTKGVWHIQGRHPPSLLWSVSLPQSLLGEPVHCFLMGSSVDLSGMRSFLATICSPFWGVSFLGVSFTGTSFTGVSLVGMLLGDAFHD